MGKRNLFQKGLQVQAFSDNGMFPYFVVLRYVIIMKIIIIIIITIVRRRRRRRRIIIMTLKPW